MLLRLAEFAQHIDHVDWNSDRSRLISDRTGDCLANPPGSVGAELKSAAILVFVDGPHQTGVSFLNQV